jgi:hypothetical protein
MSDPKYETTGNLNDRVIEECSELIKELCKAKRFGYFNYHPLDSEKILNINRIRNEIKDCEKVFEQLKQSMNDAEYLRNRILKTLGKIS